MSTNQHTFLQYVAGAILVLLALACFTIFVFDNLNRLPVDPSVTALIALVVGTATTILGVNVGTGAINTNSERVASAVIRANGHGPEVAAALSAKPNTTPLTAQEQAGYTLPASPDNPLAGPA